MKKVYSIVFLLGIFILAGCSGTNLTATQIVEENAPIIKASKEIDAKLAESIKNEELKFAEVEGKEIKEDPYEVIKAEIWSAREAQKDLYEKINNQQVLTKYNKLKYKYLSLIDHKIGNYDLLYDLSNNGSYESILQQIEKNEITTKRVEEHLLITINNVLEEDEESKIDDLYEKKEKNKK